jgi:hypothetical protein
MTFLPSMRALYRRWPLSLLVALAPLCMSAPAAAQDASVKVDPYSAWWTGSLASAHGHTMPVGHTVVEPYLIYSIPLTANPTHTFVPLVVATAGITDAFDFQLLAQGVYQAQGKVTSTQLGDTSLRLGYQMLEDRHNGDWIPDLMFFARETFPTGRYDQLDPARKGTDASGSGAYTTSLGINIQKVVLPSDQHQLRLRLNMSFQIRSGVPIRGLSSYGGSPDTAGDVYPGKSFNLLVAAEYHFTKNWVAALDLGYSYTGPDAFVASPGAAASGPAAAVGGGRRDRVSFAPALEYNFNDNIGIIGGVAIDVGRNVTTALSPQLALNVFH